MRAFSLIEVMVSSLLGLFILIGTVQLGSSVLKASRGFRYTLRSEQALAGVMADLRRDLRGIESAFWEAYPLHKAMVHPVDHRHGPWQFTHECPESDRACLIYGDLKLQATDATVFNVTFGADGRSLVLQPSGMGRPPELMGMGNMSVLALRDQDHWRCVLVEKVEGNVVALIPYQDQPWALIDGFVGDVEAVHLGRLEIHHRGLLETDAHQRSLFDEIWVADPHWNPSLRQMGKEFLVDLLWETCDETTGDRLVFVTSHPKSRSLRKPRIVAGRPFRREVDYDTLEL